MSTNFSTFCFVMYQKFKQMTGREVLRLFNETDVWGYIASCPEALSAQSDTSLSMDIDEYIQNRLAKANTTT